MTIHFDELETASQELDELMATRIMRWRKETYEAYGNIVSSWYDRGYKVASERWSPSHDEAASMLVQGCLKQFSWRIEWDVDYGINHRTGWSVHVAGHCLVQFAPTMPLAICLAAERLLSIHDDDPTIFNLRLDCA